MTRNSTAGRITDLDCMRGLAILLVVFYHFFSRWDNLNLYSSDSIDDFFVFKYGYLGVELFFIISGFVIFLSLERSKNYITFIRNRLTRLLPLLLICSLLTFLVLKAIPNEYFKTNAIDFLPSISFIDPVFWRIFFNNSNINFIDGVYWSLLVEMKFYLIVGALFFLFKREFISVWLLVNVIILLINWIGQSINISNTDLFQLFRLISFSEFFSYFTYGIVFYLIYMKRPLSVFQRLLIVFIISLHFQVFLSVLELSFLIFCFILFYAFVTRKKYFKVFSNKFLLFLGGISYPLYLLHQNIGVLFIGHINKAIDQKSIVQYLVPILVFCILVILAWLMHNYCDLNLQRKIKSYVNREKHV
ncbi:acyltransferase family protein [Sphingobacterium sp. DK4209]|uniref:Acyltransferase family protein n=1 Tax=Sphingobacterium zhuxiongii TaxID=2662364 RepID=A0A5Q0QCQ3_9SPHI|nr:acyltransferase family protein [Sphingobacterium sp. DK4209]QGA27957.1 acyltransferase family protein [Sphingobacterium sp. dk4302]